MGMRSSFEARGRILNCALTPHLQPRTTRQTTPTSRSSQRPASLARYVCLPLRIRSQLLLISQFPTALAEKWAKSAHYYNSCGPTEVGHSHATLALPRVYRRRCGQVTIINTAHLHTPGEFLTIGAPVPNTNVYVLDEDMNPCPIGEPGVMWAGGACVSKGYLNLPDKTAERYKPDPFVNDGCVGFSIAPLGTQLRSRLT